MHLVLTGATGLVGTAVLDAMIKAKDVTKISILTRRPVAMADAAKDSRINVVLQNDFGSYDPEVLGQLKGATGCVWALGISQTKVSKEEYVKITKDYALEAAKAFASLPSDPQEPFRFVYVSGEGATHSPGLVTPIFGRVKGETELALADMRRANPLLRADTMRPGGVDPSGHDAIMPFIPPWTGIQRLVGGVLLPVLRTMMKSQMSPTEPLGRFLVEMAMGKWDGRMSGPGVTELGESRVLSNAAFRRLAGI